ncbi:ECF transporter S component [Bifidobacterium sp. 82T10]|uniref:ECF transporter S component n=2 Tax=Bifidobacterium miconis TaxID=2834435 RepID=A0ABS6WDR9_9BIFI|nr:ECF transporter S component [Bifidobacterium miconis]
MFTAALPSVKFQTAAAIIAVVAAVALPQVFHVAGAALGLGTMIGQTLLPMHLPVLLVGLLAGPFAGLATGALAPIASFALTGMPMAPMVPFMIIELASYGLFAGLLRGVRLPATVPSPLGWLAKLVGAQIAGRIVDALAIAVAVSLLGNTSMTVASVAAAVVTGLPGLVLQWVLVPVVMTAVDRRRD